MEVVCGAHELRTNCPRSFVKRYVLPKIDCAAVAPRHTTILGWIKLISASSHGLHALISIRVGVLV